MEVSAPVLDIEIADNIIVNDLIYISEPEKTISNNYKRNVKNKIIFVLIFLLSSSCGYILYVHNEIIKESFVKFYKS
jgi:hypothetical protein